MPAFAIAVSPAQRAVLGLAYMCESSVLVPIAHAISPVRTSPVPIDGVLVTGDSARYRRLPESDNEKTFNLKVPDVKHIVYCNSDGSTL